MSDRRVVGALFDGSFEGLLSIVHAYYYGGLLPVEIGTEEGFQQSLDTAYTYVASDAAQAEKVLSAMRKKLSNGSVENVFAAFAHNNPMRYMDIFQYIVAGFHYGRMLDNYEQIDYVLAVHKQARHTLHEAHLLKGFTRFTKTADGIFYADIEPNCDVLHILAVHFAERLREERWIIHDVGRGTAAVYNLRTWEIMEAPAQAANITTEDGDGYGALWSAFYEAIMIKERKNPRQKRTMMPKYFWKHMVEHQAPLKKEIARSTKGGQAAEILSEMHAIV